MLILSSNVGNSMFFFNNCSKISLQKQASYIQIITIGLMTNDFISNCFVSFKLQSFLKNAAFIVTKYPPLEDAVDFLRLLIDHESHTVICMNSLNEIESVSEFVLLKIHINTMKRIACRSTHYDEYKHSQILMKYFTGI